MAVEIGWEPPHDNWVNIHPIIMRWQMKLQKIENPLCGCGGLLDHACRWLYGYAKSLAWYTAFVAVLVVSCGIQAT